MTSGKVSYSAQCKSILSPWRVLGNDAACSGVCDKRAQVEAGCEIELQGRGSEIDGRQRPNGMQDDEHENSDEYIRAPWDHSCAPCKNENSELKMCQPVVAS